MQQNQQKQQICAVFPSHPVCAAAPPPVAVQPVISSGPAQRMIPSGFPVATTTNATVICPVNSEWNGTNCVQASSPEVVLSCHANQVAVTSSDGKSLICSNPTDANDVNTNIMEITDGPSATNVPEAKTTVAFTNVCGFKSRKDRQVESFSQNMNGKCKARY